MRRVCLIITFITLIDVLHTQTININYDKLTKDWKSVRDCPRDLYEKYFRSFAVNGVPAYEREFAHIAAIGWTDVVTGEINWNCGGSIISENFILTAAHCSIYLGVEPDAVRLGDLDLRDDENDESETTEATGYVLYSEPKPKPQQFKIAEIIRHPLYKSNLNYHDLALLRLNGSITVTNIVCPACIWTNPIVEFESLEACGYGQTGLYDDKSLNLLKVTLSPVETTVCSSFYPSDRKLKSGLTNEQICAVDPEGRQDTCLGDSGGPLQIKLLAGLKMHPFIIGVTSFGKGCGTDTPGVYVRLSEYTDWIQSVTGISLEPKDCVSKYSDFRENEPDVISSKTSSVETFDFTKAHLNIEPYPLDFVARIGYRSGQTEYNWPCGGTFITSYYVLTTASCLKSQTHGSTHVKTGNSKSQQYFNIAKIIIHPKFIAGNLENDIALVFLKEEVKFSEDLHPICLWDKNELPKDALEVVGLSSTQVHRPGLFEYANKTLAYTGVRSSRVPPSECSSFHKKSNIAVSDNHICHANSLYIVPDSCQLDIGGPVVKRENTFNEGFFPYQFGINIQGKDCGFGYPTVATKVSLFIDWIDSVIFDKKPLFSDDEQTDCKVPGGKRGVCKKSSECMHVVNMVKRGEISLSDYACDFTDKWDPQICCIPLQAL